MRIKLFRSECCEIPLYVVMNVVVKETTDDGCMMQHLRCFQLSRRMLRPFSKLTCESENQEIKNLESKITGLREKVRLREETASCTYISQTVIIIRATFFISPQVNSMK